MKQMCSEDKTEMYLRLCWFVVKYLFLLFVSVNLILALYIVIMALFSL